MLLDKKIWQMGYRVGTLIGFLKQKKHKGQHSYQLFFFPQAENIMYIGH